MKKFRCMAIGLVCAMILSCVTYVPALATENDATTDEDTTSVSAEYGDNANSWRYIDGEPIQRVTLATTTYTTQPTDVEGVVGFGIDVSKSQGDINWEAAQAAGVEFTMIRCGYGQNYECQDDPYWEINANACENLGIPYGVYLYSYATTVDAAISEAEHVLRLVEGHDLSYPIYYDMEDESQGELSADELAAIAEAFCSTIEAAGYEVGIYANLNWFTTKLTDEVFDQWDRWVAQWNTTCEYEGDYTMWQCSSSGIVDGISGNVDLNLDFGAAIASADTECTHSYEEDRVEPTCTEDGSIIYTCSNCRYSWTR